MALARDEESAAGRHHLAHECASAAAYRGMQLTLHSDKSVKFTQHDGSGPIHLYPTKP